MNPKLLDRIDAQATWTFRECLALGLEFNVKTRMVIAMVMMRGKQYTDSDAGGSFTSDKPAEPG